MKVKHTLPKITGLTFQLLDEENRISTGKGRLLANVCVEVDSWIKMYDWKIYKGLYGDKREFREAMICTRPCSDEMQYILMTNGAWYNPDEFTDYLKLFVMEQYHKLVNPPEGVTQGCGMVYLNEKDLYKAKNKKRR